MKFVGVDVAGAKKGQTVAVLTHELQLIQLHHGLQAEGLADRIYKMTGTEAIVAIDSPRSPPANPDGKWGRECERELHRRGIRVQWTPPVGYFNQKDHDKEWMAIGFKLFADFAELKKAGSVKDVIEVFPSASYQHFGDLRLGLPFNLFDRKAKTDQLDAVCCALVAWCKGYGHDIIEEVGDPEEGVIVLPNCI